MPLPPRVQVKGRKSSFCPPLLLQGVAMSHQGPPLLQEDEDDGENGDENGQVEEIQELHNCML